MAGAGGALCNGRSFADGAVVEFLPAGEFANVMRVEETDHEQERLVVFAGDKFGGESGVVGVDVAGI